MTDAAAPQPPAAPDLPGAGAPPVRRVRAALPEVSKLTARSAVGAEAAMDLLEALCGPLLARDGNRWVVVLDRRDVPSVSSPMRLVEEAAGTLESVRAKIQSLAEVVQRRGGTAYLKGLVENLDHPPGPQAAAGRHAFTSFQVHVDLVELYREAGPLFDVSLRLPGGEIDRTRMGVGHLAKARAFMAEHLTRGPFRPTVVLDRGWTWALVYALKRPWIWCDDSAQRLASASRSVARWIHGGSAAMASSALPLPLGGPESGLTRCRLLHVDPARRYDADRVVAMASTADATPSAAKPTAATRVPLALRMRTLPEDWDLEDLDLSPDLRQLLATRIEVNGEIILDAVPLLVRGLCLRRHAWADVELLLEDRRFGLSTDVRFDAGHRAGLRRLFVATLAKVPTAYPTRLPYGIRRILEIPQGTPGAPRRYVVRCGTRARPIELEVLYDVLVSAPRFRSALGNRLGSIPYPVVAEAWRLAIGLGLRDRRIYGQVAARNGGHRPLPELLCEYAASATPWLPADDRAAGERRWPVLRDGFAVFPLAHLQAIVGRTAPSALPGRNALAALIRSLGGANHGPMRFGHECVRVWQLPWRDASPGSPQSDAGVAAS